MSKKDICDKSMSFDECELAILRVATDKAEERVGKASVNSPEVKKIIEIVEQFLKKKQLVAYGGTAINSILPKEDQFYDKMVLQHLLKTCQTANLSQHLISSKCCH